MRILSEVKRQCFIATADVVSGQSILPVPQSVGGIDAVARTECDGTNSALQEAGRGSSWALGENAEKLKS